MAQHEEDVQCRKEDNDDGNGDNRGSFQSSVAFSVFGNKQQNDKRGKGVKWSLESEFESMVEFDDSAALQDLMDNYNMNSKKVNKDDHIIRTFFSKFSKKKKGFDCPLKSCTILAGNKMTVYRLEDTEHNHDKVKDKQRRNFNFDKRVVDKMEELLELNVNSRNIRKYLIKEGYFDEETALSDRVFYSKTSNLRKKLNLDSKTFGMREFEDIIEEFSKEPEYPAEPFIMWWSKTKLVSSDFGANVVRAHARFPCEGRRSGH